MGEFFNPEKGIWAWLSTLVDVCGLSIFWACLCLPVVTIGPATAALYYTVVKCVRGRENGAFGYFFRSFLQNFKVGLLAGLTVIPLALLLLGQLSWPLKPSSQVSQHSFRFYSASASCSGTVLFPAPSLKLAFKS